MGKFLKTLVLTGLVSLAACENPQLKMVRDINRDSIPDVEISATSSNGLTVDWIFLSQRNGTYLRLRQDEHYFYKFHADNGLTYVMDSLPNTLNLVRSRPKH